MIKFLINRPIAVFMTTLAFLMLGLVASYLIPTSLMPDLPIPEISVQINYPNSTARELETNVVRSIRNQLLQVSNLLDINSETRDGNATLKLKFEHGTNTNLAFIEANEKIDAAMNYLPKDIDRPKVIKASSTDIPIINLAITLKKGYSQENFLELSEFTETVIKKRIEQLPDIALADINGISKPEILITPYKEKIQSLGITNDLLINSVKQNNFELGDLFIKNGIYQYNFKFANPLKNKKDIENIYLNIQGKLYRLKSLAKVSIMPQKNRGLVFYNGKRAIMLSIIKQANAKVYHLKETLKELTNSFVKDYPDLEFNTNQDQAKLLKISIDNLKSSLWIGSILAILIMFLFVKDIKSPLIIAISIPMSLFISILFLYLLKLSINIISLSGLILGVGMMIDNSIIVIDNISQKIKEGNTLFEACTKGTNEIITPLISSVLTTCSVFLPLLFLSGITGALFYDQALAVTIGLSSSLLVSIFLIPVIYNIIQQKKYKVSINIKTIQIENWYEKGFTFFFKRKKIIYIIAGVFIFLAFIFITILPYKQLPYINQNEAILKIDWNTNINLEENNNRLTSLFKNINYVNTLLFEVGEEQYLLQRENTKSFSEATVYIETKSISDINKIKQKLKNDINNLYPSAKFSIRKPKNIFQYIFGDTSTKLSAQISSRNSMEIPEVTELTKINNLLDGVTSSDIALKKTIFIEIIHENMLLYSVSYDRLIDNLKSTFNENFIDNLKTSKKFIPIKLNYNLKDFEKTIVNTFIRNNNDQLIGLKNLIKINNSKQYKSITGDRNGEYLQFNLKENENIKSTIEKLQDKFKNQDKFNIKFTGDYFNLKDLTNEFIVVIIVAIFLLYFIMAAQFESLWQPLIVLLEIPIDIGGALLFLWLFNGTINVMSIIGIVVMSGVIINDSILKLHTINMLIGEGQNVKEAIKNAGTLRLKPILMTSLTTILALTPFLFMRGLGAELQKPMALTVIGGMLIGTFISLYFIPVMYALFSKK